MDANIHCIIIGVICLSSSDKYDVLSCWIWGTNAFQIKIKNINKCLPNWKQKKPKEEHF